MLYINEKSILEAVENGNLEAVKALVNEALENEKFSTTDKKRYNAFKSLAKKFSKDKILQVKPALAGAFKNEDGLLTLSNIYMVITLNLSDLENCIMIDEGVKAIKTKFLFDDNSVLKPLDLDINNVLVEIKKAKARKDKDYVYSHKDIIHFNPNYLKNINDCLDLTREETRIQWSGAFNPIIMENDNGKAVLCPIRVVK